MNPNIPEASAILSIVTFLLKENKYVVINGQIVKTNNANTVGEK